MARWLLFHVGKKSLRKMRQTNLIKEQSKSNNNKHHAAQRLRYTIYSSIRRDKYLVLNTENSSVLGASSQGRGKNFSEIE